MQLLSLRSLSLANDQKRMASKPTVQPPNCFKTTAVRPAPHFCPASNSSVALGNSAPGEFPHRNMLEDGFEHAVPVGSIPGQRLRPVRHGRECLADIGLVLGARSDRQPVLHGVAGCVRRASIHDSRTYTSPARSPRAARICARSTTATATATGRPPGWPIRSDFVCWCDREARNRCVIVDAVNGATRCAARSFHNRPEWATSPDCGPSGVTTRGSLTRQLTTSDTGS